MLKANISDLTDKNDIESLKERLGDIVVNYKTSYQRLKDMKIEIEHLHHLLDQARHRLTRDFENWFETVYLASSNSDYSKAQSDYSRSFSRNDSGKEFVSASNSGNNAREMTEKYERSLNSSMDSVSLEKKVNDDIQAFYKAREKL